MAIFTTQYIHVLAVKRAAQSRGYRQVPADCCYGKWGDWRRFAARGTLRPYIEPCMSYGVYVPPESIQKRLDEGGRSYRDVTLLR